MSSESGFSESSYQSSLNDADDNSNIQDTSHKVQKQRKERKEFEMEEEEEDKQDMVMPLFFELASSLNVELVYVILKSITQFAYVTKTAQNQRDGQGASINIEKKKK